MELLRFFGENPELAVVLVASPILSVIVLIMLVRAMIKDILKGFNSNNVISRVLDLFNETNSNLKEQTRSIEKNTEVSKEVVGAVNATANDTLDYTFSNTKAISALKTSYEVKSEMLGAEIKKLQNEIDKTYNFVVLKSGQIEEFFKRIESKVDVIGADLVKLQSCTNDEERIKQIAHIVLETVKEEIRKEQVVAIETTTETKTEVSTE